MSSKLWVSVVTIVILSGCLGGPGGSFGEDQKNTLDLEAKTSIESVEYSVQKGSYMHNISVEVTGEFGERANLVVHVLKGNDTVNIAMLDATELQDGTASTKLTVFDDPNNLTLSVSSPHNWVNASVTKEISTDG